MNADLPLRIKSFFSDFQPQTPCLVVDSDIIEKRLRQLCNTLPFAECFYSVKANPAPEVIAQLVRFGIGFETASLNEVQLCIDSGAMPDKIIFGNTVKRKAEIADAYKKGVTTFVFDCIGELEKIAQAAPESHVLCRIAADNSGAVWPLTRKFGCAAEHAESLLIKAKELGVVPVGISFHVGSQQCEPKSWENAIYDAYRIFQKLSERGIELKILDIGGGFPAQYRNSVPEIEVYGECIIGFLQKYFGGAMPNIFIEPGRYFVADAGVIAGEVLLIRDDIDGTGRRWVFLDTGKFNGLQETERTQYRIASSGVGSHLVPVVLAGPTCDSDDIIYEKTPYFLPDNLTLGDKVFFLSAGAYTRTYATVNFNGFVPLKEYYI